MRVAIVTETYPPEVNGVALTVRGLETGLRARGHLVDVVRPRQCPADTPGPHEMLVPGLALPCYAGLRFGLPATTRLNAHWTRTRPDALYVATEGPLGWAALRAARALGIPAASGLHTRFDLYMADYGAGRLRGAALRWMRHFHGGADATVVSTRELACFLRRNRFGNVVRLARAVDTARFHPDKRDATLRRVWGVNDDDVALLHVGRIAAEKNLGLAVRAFRAVKQIHPRARMVWIGDGPERAALASANPDFIFCGVQSGDTLARHFASGDLFIFPSLSETFGNVTLEAMASGIATVAFNTGAAREHLRDNVHGAAVRVGDEHAFIAAARRIAGDEPRRSAMGRAAREAVAHLEPAQVAADFEAVLHGLVDTRHVLQPPHPSPSPLATDRSRHEPLQPA